MIKINRSGVTLNKNLCSCRWSPTFNFLDYLSIHPSIPLHLKCKVNLESYSKITFKVISKRYASDWEWQPSHSLVLYLCDHNSLYSLCIASYFSKRSIFLTARVSMQFIRMKNPLSPLSLLSVPCSLSHHCSLSLNNTTYRHRHGKYQIIKQTMLMLWQSQKATKLKLGLSLQPCITPRLTQGSTVT